MHDVVRSIVRLADLLDEPPVGRSAMSGALRQVARVLEPFDHLTVREFSSALRPARDKFRTNSRVTAIQSEGSADIRNLPVPAIEGMISSEETTKARLIEIGVERFGISRSRLSRLTKRQVVDAVRGAMNHEKSMDAISGAARVRGRRSV